MALIIVHFTYAFYERLLSLEPWWIVCMNLLKFRDAKSINRCQHLMYLGVDLGQYFIELLVAHYIDVIMGPMASQITSVSMLCWTVCSGADQRKHKSSASLAFVRGIHRWPPNSHHKGPVTRKMFPFDDVIMSYTPPIDLTATAIQK